MEPKIGKLNLEIRNSMGIGVRRYIILTVF